MRPLLAVRHQPSAHLGVIPETLAAEGVPYTYLDAWTAGEWPDPRDYSGLVVLGGEMNTDQWDDHPWLERVRHCVEEALDAGLPMLGICLGAQTLARALDADVYPAPVREVGFCDIAATPSALDDPVARPFDGRRVFQWHEDAFELPRGATLLFTGIDVVNQAFKLGRAYGVQFHFEVDERVIADWCDETDPDALAHVWGTSKADLLAQARRFLPAQRAAAAHATRAWTRLLSRDGRGG